MTGSEKGWTENAYAGGAIDALWRAYAYHSTYAGEGEAYNFTEADKEADAACKVFDEMDDIIKGTDTEVWEAAYAIGHAARRAGYFAGWKHAAMLFMDIMALVNTDTDGITARARKAAGFVK